MTQSGPSVPDGPALNPVLTVDEAAVYLRISRSLAFAALRDGTLPSLRIGRRILVPRRQLDALLDGDADIRPTVKREPQQVSRSAERGS